MTEEEIIKAYLSRLGKKGGSVKGPQKVRPREHYQKAVGIRWAKYRERQTEAQATNGSAGTTGALAKVAVRKRQDRD
jgi:hypothetical protein